MEAWKEFETEIGEDTKLEKVLAKMPRRVKKRQKIVSDDGVEEGWEEVFDYIFPEDEMVRPNLKLLAAAKQWRKQKEVPEPEPEPEATSHTPEQPPKEQSTEEPQTPPDANVDKDDSDSSSSDSDS